MLADRNAQGRRWLLNGAAHCFDRGSYVAFMSHGSGIVAAPCDGLKIPEPPDFIGDPSRIRTCNPRSRNPLLYPVELWDRYWPYIIANMKNPHFRQARSEPFSLSRRQSLARLAVGFGPP